MRSNGIHLSLALIASMGFISLTGCGGDGDGDSKRIAQLADAAKNTVTTIAIADNEKYVHYKGFYQFELLGRDADGKETNLTQKATWKISDPSLGTIKKGYFTAAGSAGDFTLTAEYAGLVATQQINVSDANLEAITVSHPTGSVDECRNTTFSAEARFNNGKILPYPLTWKVIDGAGKASFKEADKNTLSTTDSGIITVIASGTDNNGVQIQSDPYTFNISEALTKIEVAIDRSSTELRAGDTANVKVTGIYGDPANPIDIAGNTTFTATPSELLIIEGAKITAKGGSSSGTKVTLKGACGGAEGTQDLTVKSREVKSLDIQDTNGATAGFTVQKGDNRDFRAVATFVDGSSPDTDFSDVEWTINYNNAIADDDKKEITVSTAGILTVTSELDISSSVTITLEVKLKGNSSIKDSVSVTITP